MSGPKQKIENISGVIVPPRKINRVRIERVTRCSFRCGVRGHRRQMRVYRHPSSYPAGRGHLVSASFLLLDGEVIGVNESTTFSQNGLIREAPDVEYTCRESYFDIL